MLSYRAVDVALAEGLAGRPEHHDLVGPRRQRRLVALHVGGEHRIGHARLAHDARHHLGVVGHLRHPFRADEAGHLDVLQAGGLQAVHQLDLGGGGHRLFFVLQAVAGRDVDQLDGGGVGG